MNHLKNRTIALKNSVFGSISMVVEEILFDKLILNYIDAKLQNFANATE